MSPESRRYPTFKPLASPVALPTETIAISRNSPQKYKEHTRWIENTHRRTGAIDLIRCDQSLLHIKTKIHSQRQVRNYAHQKR